MILAVKHLENQYLVLFYLHIAESNPSAINTKTSEQPHQPGCSKVINRAHFFVISSETFHSFFAPGYEVFIPDKHL
jgi:hypothetical protein